MPRFTPTCDASLAQLRAVVPLLGRDYATGRNTDRGPDAPRPSTSALSPWLRHGLLLEGEAIRAALSAHGSAAATKSVEEAAWRAYFKYFKGWLEGRPAVWDDALRACPAASDSATSRMAGNAVTWKLHRMATSSSPRARKGLLS